MGNAEELAVKIEQHLQQDLPHRDEHLIARIQTEYNWDQIARQTMELFRGVCG
jgi:uncharacterized protein YtpQ (UPF0354 family)